MRVHCINLIETLLKLWCSETTAVQVINYAGIMKLWNQL